MITCNIETISPTLAAQYLQHNLQNNRKLNKRAIDEYAEQMKRGQWVMNGDSIRFDTEGKLIDGQHRLQAIIASGSTIDTLVMRGIESQSFFTLDSGRRRNTADLMSMKGSKYPSVVAGALNAMLRIENTKQPCHDRRAPVSLSKHDFLKLADEHPDMEQCARTVCSRFGKVTQLVSPSYATALYYLFSKKDAAEADAFFFKLCNGIGMEAGSPIYLLREKLLLNMGEIELKKLSLSHRAAYVVKAWNYIRDPRPFKQFIVRVTDTIEEIK